jgi:hypothetical protein
VQPCLDGEPGKKACTLGAVASKSHMTCLDDSSSSSDASYRLQTIARRCLFEARVRQLEQDCVVCASPIPSIKFSCPHSRPHAFMRQQILQHDAYVMDNRHSFDVLSSFSFAERLPDSVVSFFFVNTYAVHCRCPRRNSRFVGESATCFNSNLLT